MAVLAPPAAALALAALAAPAAGAAGEPANARLTAPPRVVAAGPPNGAFAEGLTGWTSIGRDAPALVPVGSRTAARLATNVTLVSAPFAVPAGGQVLAVSARAPRGGADAEIRALPEDGGPEVTLGLIVPGPRLSGHAVSLAGLEGRTVRIAIDPVPTLGRAVEVAGVGPVVRALPGWRLLEGLPRRTGAGGRVLAVDDPLTLASAPFRARPARRALQVSLRGEGVLTLSAGGRTVRARAGARWRAVAVPVRPGRGAVLRVRADPRGGEMRLRGLGLAAPRGV